MEIATLDTLSIFLKKLRLNFAKSEHSHVLSDITDFHNGAIEILKSAYPVGSIYISVSATPPSELFGFGEWEQIKDVFLLSAGDTYDANTTGGTASYYLTQDQTPYYKTDNEVEGYGLELTGGFEDRVIVERPSSERSSNSSQSSIDNMPPYLTVYMWKRIA